MADELENTPCALMGEAMARYKHDELTAGEAVSIILEQAKRLSPAPTEADTSLQKVQTTPPDMEAVAWRYPVLTARDEAVARMARAMRNGKAWPAVFQANTAEALAEDALTALEALAVIPTEGLGSFSQAKIPTEGQPTSNSHIQTGDKNDRP